jgi:hypothetical protein
MTRHLTSKLLPVIATGLLAVVAVPAIAAERGSGGMRQQPLNPAFDGRSRIPGPGLPSTGPGIKGPAEPRFPGTEPAPPAGTSITHRGTRYVVTDGRWYEQRGADLVAVTPPAGVLVRDLPQGHSMRWIGGAPYFYADGLYYVWRERERRYEIVQTPPAAQEPARPREPGTEAAREPATP